MTRSPHEGRGLGQLLILVGAAMIIVAFVLALVFFFRTDAFLYGRRALPRLGLASGSSPVAAFAALAGMKLLALLVAAVCGAALASRGIMIVGVRGHAAGGKAGPVEAGQVSESERESAAEAG